ncbi:MAG TPA: hypothetical protein VGW10_13590 [Solirubrobacteraceae bacterium]|nr:hypothetical protein [Solirubrobacteraceae bacterium]
MLSNAQLSMMNSPVTIRPARSGEERALADLARLDSAPPLDGDVLVAESEHNALAAIDVISGRLVADPFRRTASEAALLRARAEQMRSRRDSRRRLLGRLGFAR